MKPLRRRLQEQAKSVGLRLDTIQQDYLLTWLLQGISQNPRLGKNLIFKGGTALKKCYFGDYRFSEDLDFTALQTAPQYEDLESEIQRCCAAIQEKLQQHAPMDISCERYRERQPHPHGQEAFVVRARFPWQGEPLTRVMIEVTQGEEMAFSAENRPLLHPYETNLDGEMLTYSLNEIVLEKLRAILQHTKKLHERDWSRSRARDYYDLWHILCGKESNIDIPDVSELLRMKCAPKKVSFDGPDDFFEPIMIAHVRQTWQQWLGPLVSELPPVSGLLDELKPAVVRLID